MKICNSDVNATHMTVLITQTQTELSGEGNARTENSLDDNVSRTPLVIRSALFGIMFIAAVSLTVIGTLFALSGETKQAEQAYPILIFNLGLVVLLGGYLAFRIWQALFAKAISRAAPLLHRRFVLFFSTAALIPALLVGAFSTSLISQDFNEVFGEKVRQNLDSAHEFLNQYLEGELRQLAWQVRNLERFIESNKSEFNGRISFKAYLERYAQSLEVDSVYVLNKEGYVYVSKASPSTPEFRIPASYVLEYIEKQGVTGLQTRDEDNYLVSLTKLDGIEDAFLYVGKKLTSDVGILSSLTDIQEAQQSLTRYNRDQSWSGRVFLLVFVEAALLMLIAAVWLGVIMANRIIDPLGGLVVAAEKVRGGDLTARVKVKRSWGEISNLGSAFNRMTRQLSSQREALVNERDISEQRRQFSEAVLSGVTAGVIGLSEDGRITLVNSSAERLMGIPEDELLGRLISEEFPAFSEAFTRARENISQQTEYQITMEAETGEQRNFDLRVSAYQSAGKEAGWVLTFDDMTRLVAAQRHSAWREVARRIAHEIKNPLTPIQLSAERLQRKYGRKIDHEPDIFENCTQTILRQVENLEAMVDEFSSFSRMPTPNFKLERLELIVDKCLFEQGVAFPDIRFSQSVPDSLPLLIDCDERLLSQALANLYKNAALSVNQRIALSGLPEPDGEVRTQIAIANDKSVLISIIDNGQGWPFTDKDRLLEPYVTTRDTGTGLGLPIVKRILEDHNGQLLLLDRPDGKSGARVDVILPLKASLASSEEKGKLT